MCAFFCCLFVCFPPLSVPGSGEGCSPGLHPHYGELLGTRVPAEPIGKATGPKPLTRCPFGMKGRGRGFLLLCHPSAWSRCVWSTCGLRSRVTGSAPPAVRGLVLSTADQIWKNWCRLAALVTSSLEICLVILWNIVAAAYS